MQLRPTTIQKRLPIALLWKKNPEYNHHLKSLIFTGITLVIVLVSFMGTLIKLSISEM